MGGGSAISLFSYAVVGTIDRKFGGTEYRIIKIISHPKLNERPFLNDISLFRTKDEISFNEYVQPIALPTADLPEEGNVFVTVSGWGATLVSFSLFFYFFNLTNKTIS